MKNKILIFFLTLCVCLTLAACGDNGEGNENEPPEQKLLDFTGITMDDLTVEYDGKVHSVTASGVPENATVTYNDNEGSNVGVYNAKAVVTADGYNALTLTAKLEILLPTAKSVVAARQKAIESAKKAYDFKLNFNGTVNLWGVNQTANANYDGQYRYDGDSNTLKFKRVTSGILLYDSQEYIYNEGDSKIVIKSNEDGVAKSISLLPFNDEELKLVNIPFETLVNGIKENNITKIEKSNGQYKFKASLKLSSDNPMLAKVLNIVGSKGNTLEMSDVKFVNPVSGFELYFDYDKDMKLVNYKMSTSVSFPIKGVAAKLTLSYEQKASDAEIEIPSIKGFSVSEEDKQADLDVIAAALQAVKNGKAYSIDFEATNEFDPGWNVTATKDSYKARMYKNTYKLDENEFIAFNHSYEYKTHHETDGSETYKYTVANTQENKVYKVSRKGTNVIDEVTGVTADTRFDYLLSYLTYAAKDVECVSKTTKNGSTFYNLAINGEKVIEANEKIMSLINSNDAEGVIKVNNYFNENRYMIKDAIVVVEMKNGEIASISLKTEVRYNPVGGDYTEENITLTDKISIIFNDNPESAKKYTAPKKEKTSLGSVGLNNAKYYIA